MCGAGYDNLMYAYPVATDCSVRRVVELSKKCNFIIRIDGLEAAQAINAGAAAAGVKVNYTIIIDSGLHRFGVKPEAMAEFARAMTRFENLTFVGLSTHAGHVYAAQSGDEVPKYVAEEKAAVKASLEAVRSVGLEPEIIPNHSCSSANLAPAYMGVRKDQVERVIPIDMRDNLSALDIR